MNLFLKMILMKKQIGEDKDGLKLNGKNGARPSSASGMTNPALEKIFPGMSCRLKRSPSSLMKCWVGYS